MCAHRKKAYLLIGPDRVLLSLLRPFARPLESPELLEAYTVDSRGATCLSIPVEFMTKLIHWQRLSRRTNVYSPAKPDLGIASAYKVCAK